MAHGKDEVSASTKEFIDLENNNNNDNNNNDNENQINNEKKNNDISKIDVNSQYNEPSGLHFKFVMIIANNLRNLIVAYFIVNVTFSFEFPTFCCLGWLTYLIVKCHVMRKFRVRYIEN
ncbi:hypothetical protein RhiirA4_431481 [Rhizophagus irregularis]|uniref:Uncharacterized protein n=1 Tax=Rhizophagus irregularis TaxID=588596 RepID=A0A2I1HPX2_9GLOM|nr:hypothetical protein RhiirA4_431481 [Rhizophagus irregularis]